MSNGLIFIQIAAYRDPELLPTLRDCVAQASNAGRLRFGICWQRGADDTLGEFTGDERVRVFEVPAERSRGACWARQQTQALFREEDYTLQLDSHHRFAPGWDEQLVRMMEDLRARGHAKPLITSYVPVYNPANDPAGREQQPLRLRFDGFSHCGPFAVMPETMDEYKSQTEPEPARFFSGHFAFTVGEFCREVPYDPHLYFFGEEPAMAMRAFSHGYDLFHPHRVLVWHHYGRDNSPKHWADHRRWHFRNELSMDRFRRLVGEWLHGIVGAESSLRPFGMGAVRSFRDFELYAGVSFDLLGATRHAMKAQPPPEPDLPVSLETWRSRILLPYEVLVPLSKEELADSLEQYEFVFVGAHSKHHDELIRHDLRGDDLERAVQEGGYRLRLLAAAPPASWTVWPYLRDGTWGVKSTRPIKELPR
jgi:Glycosyltransferase (GlcNAc)